MTDTGSTPRDDTTLQRKLAAVLYADVAGYSRPSRASKSMRPASSQPTTFRWWSCRQ